MRVLAASFADREAAVRVLDELRRRFGLAPDDAAVAPLGVGAPRTHPFTVLAGRFHDDRVDEVRRLVERQGGEVMVVVDEVATRPRLSDGAGQRDGQRPERRHDQRGNGNGTMVAAGK